MWQLLNSFCCAKGEQQSDVKRFWTVLFNSHYKLQVESCGKILCGSLPFCWLSQMFAHMHLAHLNNFFSCLEKTCNSQILCFSNSVYSSCVCACILSMKHSQEHNVVLKALRQRNVNGVTFSDDCMLCIEQVLLCPKLLIDHSLMANGRKNNTADG